MHEPRQRARDSARRPPPRAHAGRRARRPAPADHHVAHRARATGRRSRRRARRRGACSASAGSSASSTTRSARQPGRDRADRLRERLRAAARRARPERRCRPSRRRRPASTLRRRAREPLRPFELAQLRERRRSRVRIAADAEARRRPRGRRAPGNVPSPRSASVVGARPATAPLAASAAISRSVMCVACTMHQRASTRGLRRAATRPAACRLHAKQSSTSRVCSAAWMWIGAPARRERDDLRRARPASPRAGCAARRRARSRAPPRARAARSTRRANVSIVCTNRRCPAVGRRAAEPGVRVEHRQQREREPGASARRRRCASASSAGSAYGLPGGIVMHVVEFGDAPCSRPSAISTYACAAIASNASASTRSRNAYIACRHVQKLSSLPRRDAPGAPGERALERVRVQVRHRRHDRARERARRRRRTHRPSTRDDRARRRRRRSRRRAPSRRAAAPPARRTSLQASRRRSPTTSATASRRRRGYTCTPAPVRRPSACDHQRMLAAPRRAADARRPGTRTRPRPRSTRTRAPARCARAAVAHDDDVAARRVAADHQVEVAHRPVDERAVDRGFAGERDGSYGRAQLDACRRASASRMPSPASSTSVRSTPGNAENGPSLRDVGDAHAPGERRRAPAPGGSAAISVVWPPPFFHGMRR